MRDALDARQLQKFRMELLGGKRRLQVSWDSQRAGSLGILVLTLAAGMQLRKHVNLSAIDVLIIGAGTPLHDNLRHPFCRLCESFEWVDDVTCAVDAAEAARRVDDRQDTHLTWPSVEYWCSEREIDTTFRLQEAFIATREFVPLRLRPFAVERARQQLRQIEPPVVAVHLKNVPGSQSNANHSAWRSFFTQAGGQGEFLLIGDDTVPSDICALPNVTIAQEIDDDLVFHMALVQEADSFMGLMSGPCNFALVNNKPYRVFKNPDHHEKEMKIELGTGNSYPFAHPNQQVIRQSETSELLFQEFRAMIG